MLNLCLNTSPNHVSFGKNSSFCGRWHPASLHRLRRENRFLSHSPSFLGKGIQILMEAEQSLNIFRYTVGLVKNWMLVQIFNCSHFSFENQTFSLLNQNIYLRNITLKKDSMRRSVWKEDRDGDMDMDRVMSDVRGSTVEQSLEWWLCSVLGST